MQKVCMNTKHCSESQWRQKALSRLLWKWYLLQNPRCLRSSRCFYSPPAGCEMKLWFEHGCHLSVFTLAAVVHRMVVMLFEASRAPASHRRLLNGSFTVNGKPKLLGMLKCLVWIRNCRNFCSTCICAHLSLFNMLHLCTFLFPGVISYCWYLCSMQS